MGAETIVAHLICMSEPFGYDSAILSALLATARRNAAWPGDAGAIDRLFERIAADDRHLAITLLRRATATERVFPGGATMHDPAQSWLWSSDEGHEGPVRNATPEAAQRVSARTAAEASAA